MSRFAKVLLCASLFVVLSVSSCFAGSTTLRPTGCKYCSDYYVSSCQPPSCGHKVVRTVSCGRAPTCEWRHVEVWEHVRSCRGHHECHSHCHGHYHCY